MKRSLPFDDPDTERRRRCLEAAERRLRGDTMIATHATGTSVAPRPQQQQNPPPAPTINPFSGGGYGSVAGFRGNPYGNVSHASQQSFQPASTSAFGFRGPYGDSAAGSSNPNPYSYRNAAQPAPGAYGNITGGFANPYPYVNAAQPAGVNAYTQAAGANDDEVEAAEYEAADEIVFTPYVPSQKARHDQLRNAPAHPDVLVENATLATVQPPQITVRHSLSPTHAANLSDAQIETVLYAKQRHEKMLPNGRERVGFFVGDGAGVGKGRQMAAIIMDNYMDGRKKSLWLSVSPDLETDAQRDFRDIGVKTIGFCTSLGKTDCGKDVQEKEGCIFLSYNLLISKNKQGKTMFDQLINWVGGAAFDGVIILDECHKGKNVLASKPSETGQKIVELQERLPHARVVYCSATACSEPRNLAYMTRIGIFGQGLNYERFDMFKWMLDTGGYGAMELLSMTLKEMGVLVCRTLSLHGAKFEMHKVESLAKKQLYNRLAQFLQDLFQQFKDGLLNDNLHCIKGSAARQFYEDGMGLDLDELEQEDQEKLLNDTECKEMTGADILKYFWSAHQRIFRSMCAYMKLDAAVDLALKAQKDGKCVVIGLQSTGEASLNHVRAQRGFDERTEFVSAIEQTLKQLIKKIFYVPGMGKGESDSDKEDKVDKGKGKRKARNSAAKYKEESENSDADSESDSKTSVKKGKSKGKGKSKRVSKLDDSDEDSDFSLDSDSDFELKESKTNLKSELDMVVDTSGSKAAPVSSKVSAKSEPMEMDDMCIDLTLSDGEEEGGSACDSGVKVKVEVKSEEKEGTGDKRVKKKKILDLCSDSDIDSDKSDSDHDAFKGDPVVELGIKRYKTLMKMVKEMKLPESPLELLIDRLGGSSEVAEITGRKGREVRGDNGKIKYESRSTGSRGDSKHVNLRERDALQSGAKTIAVISEAGSSGISLHADASKKNQRQRVMFTLELPWAADKTVQQLGRINRSNQVEKPHYVLLMSDAGGEGRFASAVAKRLSQMGALTQGERRSVSSAATKNSFEPFNIDSQYGIAAVLHLYKMIVNRGAGETVPAPDIKDEHLSDVTKDALKKSRKAEYQDQYGMYNGGPPGHIMNAPYAFYEVAHQWLNSVGLNLPFILMKPNLKRLVPVFLNRILGLEIDAQRLLFDHFVAILERTIEDAKKDGTYEDGILTISGNVKIDEMPPILLQNNKLDQGAGAVNVDNDILMCSTVTADKRMTWEQIKEISDDALAKAEEARIEIQSRRDGVNRGIHKVKPSDILTGYYCSKRGKGGRILCLLLISMVRRLGLHGVLHASELIGGVNDSVARISRQTMKNVQMMHSMKRQSNFGKKNT